MDQKYKDAISQRLTNASNTQQAIERNEMQRNIMNALSPNYAYNPRTRSIDFKTGEHNPYAASSGTGEKSLAEHAADYKHSFPNASDADAQKYASEMVRAQHYRNTMSMSDMRKNRYTTSGTRGVGSEQDYPMMPQVGYPQ